MPAVTWVVLQSAVQKQPCGHMGFLMMMHKQMHFCARPGALALCSTAAEQEGNARAVSGRGISTASLILPHVIDRCQTYC